MPRLAPYSFMFKPAAAAALVGLADLLLFDHEIGWTLGLAALAFPLTALALRPALRRDRLALVATLAACAFALVQVERPSLVGLLLYGISLGVAVLAPRAGRSDAWRWGQRLAFLGLASPVGPWLDLIRLDKARRRGGPRRRIRDLLPVLILPAVGGAIFLGLFSAANPLIEGAVENLRLPELDVPRALFWAFGLIAAWAVLRPRTRRRWLPLPEGGAALPPGVSVASVTLSLIVFNTLFALQNGLDLAFLWSGAPLPEGVSLAEYAHRGAYPLIATALLAGLFVLVALQPGTATAERPLIRGLVVLWIAQNIFLVASTALRTADYIEVYSLTRLRIAALLWMGLVALGLALICWRLIRGRSAAWLIGANVTALALVLTVCSVVDLGAIAAQRNVRHAREVGGRGAALDVCHLRGLGSSALVSLAELERRPLPPDLADRVAWARAEAFADLAQAQSNWRSWTFRGARRLDRAKALMAGGASPSPLPGRRDCDGRLISDRANAAPRPLTSEPRP